ncbi:NADP-dependent phosphogluconate dehydrogenase [Salinispira pacifica]
MPSDNTLCDLGLVGLGVMGRNFILNLADHGYHVAGYDKDEAQVSALEKDGSGNSVSAFSSLSEFLKSLRKPRAVMLLVPAGPPVDSVIDDLKSSLDRGDIIIDGGNSHFTDTNRHTRELESHGIRFIGVGISGGADGARHGPSIMPGGQKEAYERVREMFEKAAAHVDGEPCTTYLGTGSAGHYVKMVHNGIEYALMQLIAESYDILKRGAGFSDKELHEVYQEWAESELSSFLMEITAAIFIQEDTKGEGRLIDKILDEARQKGTGKWTSQDGMDLQSPVITVHAAVAMRHLSALKEERQKAEGVLSGPDRSIDIDRDALVRKLKRALRFGFIVAYAQGFSQLTMASREYEYELTLADAARIWRGGCIIRAALLDDIRDAYADSPDMPSMLTHKNFAGLLEELQSDTRDVVAAASLHGIPVTALSSTLSYFDSYRSGWLPANLVQAQRDFFGSHTYERVDEKGSFHTQWNKLEE